MSLVGSMLGKYQILEELGVGGMGAVYRAYDPSLEREVAIKVLLPHLAHDREFVQRFLREARTAARLDHAHIVHIYEVGQAGELYYFVMAFLPGKSLARIIAERGALSLSETIAIAGQVADALDYAHGHGLIHRDVKSANLVVDDSGRVVLTDFGIARAADGTRLTATGTTIGTPEYMSPEQAEGREATAASDLYALGIIVYEMLTGEVPFHATTPVVTLLKQVQDAPPSLRTKNPSVSAAVEQAVMWALAKQPANRPSNGAEFISALRRATAGAPTAALPPAPRSEPRLVRKGLPTWVWVAGGAVLVISLALAMILIASRPAGPRSPTEPPPPPGTGVPTGRIGTRMPTIRPTLDDSDTPIPDTPVPSTPILATPIPTAVAPTSAPLPGAALPRPADGMVTLYLPAGPFAMGAAANDAEAQADERPQHQVEVEAFWLDRTEVTVEMFRTFIQSTGYRTTAEREGWGFAWVESAGKWQRVDGADWQHPAGPTSTARDDHPVVQVSWDDAAAYCRWAGGWLPTEAQWEKGARWTTGSLYPWGNSFVGSKLNYCDANCPGDWRDAGYDDGNRYTAPVGSYPAGASAVGGLDMAGNVWEWVADWYGAGYYATAQVSNPPGPGTGESKVIRGGGWATEIERVRASTRNGGHPPDYRGADVGFRCVWRP